MNSSLIPSGILFALFSGAAFAHGPQIQITNDNGKIVTREIILDGPYSGELTRPVSVYVMPVRLQDGIAYVRPNDHVDSITGIPEFLSGPGLAYGYHLADETLPGFASASALSIDFSSGLQVWDESGFHDAGPTQLKAYRGSDAAITDPLTDFAVTTDAAPFAALSLPPLTAEYDEEAHATVRYVLLGDGDSPTSDSNDGVYLAKLAISSTQSDLMASDSFFFVLHKNASNDVVQAAVSSLGVDPSRIQYVPEPMSIVQTLLFSVSLATCRRVRRRRRE